MSPQEYKIYCCVPNQRKMKCISPALAQLPSHVTHHIQLVVDIVYENPEIPWDNHLMSRGTSISIKQLEESSLHAMSSGNERWFPVFDWRDKPSFHKHLKRSFPSEICMWEGPCVFWFKWNGHWDALTRKKPGFCGRVLNASSSFISQDERMSESPVETLQKAPGLHLIWTRDSYPCDTLRGSWNSVLQKLPMPDSSWILLRIPISLCQLDSDPRSYSSLLEVSVLSCQA